MFTANLSYLYFIVIFAANSSIILFSLWYLVVTYDSPVLQYIRQHSEDMTPGSRSQGMLHRANTSKNLFQWYKNAHEHSFSPFKSINNKIKTFLYTFQYYENINFSKLGEHSILT